MCSVDLLMAQREFLGDGLRGALAAPSGPVQALLAASCALGACMALGAATRLSREHGLTRSARVRLLGRLALGMAPVVPIPLYARYLTEPWHSIGGCPAPLGYPIPVAIALLVIASHLAAVLAVERGFQRMLYGPGKPWAGHARDFPWLRLAYAVALMQPVIEAFRSLGRAAM